MFKKKPQPAPTRARTTAPPRSSTVESAISIIGPGMEIEGDLRTDGTVRVEGTIRGTIKAEKAVVIGKSGEVHGDIHTRDAVIGGRVVGTIVAESRLELQGTCTIDGEVRAAAEHILLHEGARFNGNIKMIGDEEQTPQRPPQETRAENPVPA